MYALRTCSLLAIPPPPPGRLAPQGGFPTDLVEINLSDWASLVQDVAAGLQALPPRLSNCLDPEVMTLLQRLKAVTQVRFYHLCYYLDTNSRCSGVPLLTPLTSWSRITERTPVYRMTASSGGVTTLSTSLGGMSRLVPPPPGISIWDTSPWETPIPQQLVTTPAKGHSEYEGSGATGSSDCTSHPPAMMQFIIICWCVIQHRVWIARHQGAILS